MGDIENNELNNIELKNNITSGEVNEVENDIDATESKMDNELSQELDDSYNSFINDKKISTYEKEFETDNMSSFQSDLGKSPDLNDENEYNKEVINSFSNNERSFVDKAKDTVFGVESAYDVKRYENAGIKGAFDELPRNRREAVYERFENSPDEIKKTVNDLSGELSVENTKGNDCCHYNRIDKKIRMETNLDNAEYSEIFSHEYGHFVDDKKGDVSRTYEFREAISMDLMNYDKSTLTGRKNFDVMMNDLMSTDAAYDRAVSDNMSAYFKNDPEVVNRYRNEGISYYQHDNSYWAMEGSCEAEIYANLFSMSAQDNRESCEFMQKYFPNTWEQFKKTL